MKIGFFGAGKMAEGILSAIPAKKDVIMAEKVAERAAELKNKYGVKTTDDLKAVVKSADLIFLAVRPQDVATVVLKEKDFDAVTALSGSGPAYFAYMEEAMAEGGIALGLKPAVARLLAEQTMYGTAKFLRESGMELKPFIDGVCTKGGTTAAGMTKLAVPAFKKIVAKTISKPQTVELAGMNAISVTLTENGKLVIKYVK